MWPRKPPTSRTGRADRVVSASDCYWQTMVAAERHMSRAQERAEALRPLASSHASPARGLATQWAGRIAVGVADTTSAATAITPTAILGIHFRVALSQ